MGAAGVAAYLPREQFHITQGQDALHRYQWNSGVAQHYFCGNCGIYVYHQRRSNPALLSVNACCIDGLDREALPTRQVYGQCHSVVAPPTHTV